MNERQPLEYWFAVALVCATFALLLIGGTVNPTGSSLACPEPTLVCNGQLFPEMTGGVLYEHGHRLVAMMVGLLQIALTVVLWRRRFELRPLGVLALVMVCVQGALGAVTVAYQLPWLVSTAHLLLAMAYIATLVFIAFRARVAPGTPAAGGARATTWIAVAAIAVLAQIALGGLVRHHEAALASLQLPLHEGRLWPANAPWPLKLHMAHRIVGALVGVIVCAASIAVYRVARPGTWLRRLSVLWPAIVLGQITLGITVILTFRSTPVAVAHFGGAVLLWITLWSGWLLARARAVREGV